jgi:glycerophosphoryl diester phosphodiesterase
MQYPDQSEGGAQASNEKASPRRRGWGCVAILVLVSLIYYGVQALLRTPPLTPLQIIAHRGGPKYAPENTMAAFRNAIDQSADWLEFDVQMTKDGALVVIHDETVDRTTDGTGAVRDLTLEQIRALDAGQGEKVPTFQEVLELAKTRGVKILPETKFAHLYPGVEEKMLQALEQADYLDRTVIQSFEPDSLERLHTLEPRANLCALYGLWQFNVGAPPGEAKFVCPMAEMVLLNPSMIRQAHKEGRPAFIWFQLLENPFVSGMMGFFGADGLIVNDPLAPTGP